MDRSEAKAISEIVAGQFARKLEEIAQQFMDAGWKAKEIRLKHHPISNKRFQRTWVADGEDIVTVWVDMDTRVVGCTWHKPIPMKAKELRICRV